MFSTRASTLAPFSLVFAIGCSNAPSSLAGSGDDTGAGSDAGASGSDAGDSGSSTGSKADSGSGKSSGSDSGSSSSSDSGTGSGGDSGGGPDGSSGGTADAGDPLAAARALCVKIINDDRATLNVAPLTENFAEESCVDGQAQADYMANTPHSAFGNCSEWAQDECPGWQGPPSSVDTSCLAEMWAEGPPPQGQDNHWLNMSNASYTKVACGFYQTPAGNWWATQDFW